jgi:hypothetical protein
MRIKSTFRILLLSALGFSSTTAIAQWSNLSSMTTAVASAGIAEWNGKAYICAGQGLLGGSNAVQIYNFSTSGWEAPQTLSLGRLYPCVVAGDSALYVVGGAVINGTFSGVDAVNTVDILKNGVWSTDTTPFPVSQSKPVKVGSKIMFAGGNSAVDQVNATVTPSNYVLIYDELTAQWSIDSLSEKRAFVASASDGSTAIFAGGYKSDGTTSDVVDIYDAVGNTWSTANLSQARAFASGAYANGKFVFAGGVSTQASAASDVVDVYDGQTWTVDNLSDARGSASTAVVDGKEIFFIGGAEISLSTYLPTAVSKTVDVYNVASGTWYRADLPNGLALNTSMSNGFEVYVFSGFDFNNFVTDALRFSSTIGFNELKPRDAEVIKILDLQGRETQYRANVPLIYIYDDGTVEKILGVEPK